MNPKDNRAVDSSRVWSVDILRGLTMLVMIFVNDAAGVKGLPWWNYHMPPHQNGMTYVDMVFPSFLFMVGMAIPLAIERRLAKGDSVFGLWKHVVVRALSLVVLGIYIANWHMMDPAITGIGRGVWGAAGMVGFILLWNVYPRTGRQTLYKVLKYAGLAIVVVMFAIFRRKTDNGQIAWLDFGYWEILGLIGRAYLAACILYIPFRKKTWAPLTALIVLCGMNIASRAGLLPFLRHFPYTIWPFDEGALPSIVMAGIVTSQIFLGPAAAKEFKRKALIALGYAAVLLLVGVLCLPYGISKNAATPSWCLFCCGASVLLFLGLYWLADVKHCTRWANFAKPAGSNTLLTYLLPDIAYFVGATAFLEGTMWSVGWTGAFRSVVFVAFILGISHLLTRWKIRMQL